MLVYHVRTVSCDGGCYAQLSSAEFANDCTAAQFLSWIRSFGWWIGATKQYCPKCKAKRGTFK